MIAIDRGILLAPLYLRISNSNTDLVEPVIARVNVRPSIVRDVAYESSGDQYRPEAWG